MKQNKALNFARMFLLGFSAIMLCLMSSFSYGIQGPSSAAAAQLTDNEDARVALLGNVFGIKLFSDGIIVASLSDIYTENGACCPAKEAGIKPGDFLLSADGESLSSNSAVSRLICQSEGKPITFTVKRGEKIFDAVITPAFSEDSFKAGMWVRDSAAGIGTLTFYEEESGCFAGLGHGICDSDTGEILPIKSGEPAEINLCGIERGTSGETGKLRGYFANDESLGVLLKNSESGLYGRLNEPPESYCTTEVMPINEISTGPVEILSTVDESGPRLYKAELLEVNANESTRNLVIKITDEELLEKTGGIVQGMSGSPILKEGKLIGAVTHVFTDSPAMGYGIFAQTMLNEMQKIN